MSTIFQNGAVSFAAGKQDLLKPELQAVFDENLSSAEFPEGLIEMMGYTKTKVINPEGTFSTSYGATEAPEIEEGEDYPLMPSGMSSGKGFKIKNYGGHQAITEIMMDWLETNQKLENADSSVKEAYVKFGQDYKNLKLGAIKSKNYAATRVLTSGWLNTNPNGFGSPTQYGKSLFSSTHPYQLDLQGQVQGYRNTLGGEFGTENAALSETSLEHAINLHKSELRTYVGDRVSIPNEYILVVGRRLATTARKILQAKSKMPGEYSGTGDNAMKLNMFDFDGSRVVLLEHPAIGASSRIGGNVGTDDMWFLLNMEGVKRAKALRYFQLSKPTYDIWRDNKSQTGFVLYGEKCAFDHYGAESYVVGSQGTA